MFGRKTVICEKCGHVLARDKARQVKFATLTSGGIKPGLWYYCDTASCAPSYDEYDYGLLYRRMRVHSNGTPLGYIPDPPIPEGAAP